MPRTLLHRSVSIELVNSFGLLTKEIRSFIETYEQPKSLLLFIRALDKLGLLKGPYATQNLHIILNEPEIDALTCFLSSLHHQELAQTNELAQMYFNDVTKLQYHNLLLSTLDAFVENTIETLDEDVNPAVVFSNLWDAKKRALLSPQLKQRRLIPDIKKQINEVFVAVAEGDMETFERLSNLPIDYTQIEDENGYNLIHIAVAFGNTAALSVLAKLGCCANVPAPDGMTPLFLAVEHERPQVLPILQQMLVNVEFRNPGGRTPIHEAALKNSLVMLTGLKKYNNANINEKTLKEVVTAAHSQIPKKIGTMKID